MKPKQLQLSASEKRQLLQIIDGFSRARILGIGDFILDKFVWGNVSRISPEAPVPVVDVKRESYMPGGSLNVANNIRTLGAHIYPCGVVGRDIEGRVLVKAMRREGIETGGVVVDSKRPTSLKTRIIAHSQQVVRFDRESSDNVSAGDLKKITQFVEKKIADVNVVIIEDYGKGVIQPQFVTEIIRIAKRKGKPVLVDPKEKHFSFYKGATGMTPNRKEAYAGYESLFGAQQENPSLETVGWGLLKKLELEFIMITLGEDGMALFEKGKKTVVQIPTTAQEVYDVSGAGDTVIATLALAMAAKAPMPLAAMISNLAAGIVVEKLGTATITVEELRARIESI
ncbi:MAG TPA: D-glycero-beta-D-manno-heptose-7-phosphate kinase [Candidatus Omnitrophota bacterium]|nr:D-glycero-beta-D-manno-heptose-7-phosphate kinase [Candidatus Omnitrophota bacterium]